MPFDPISDDPSTFNTADVFPRNPMSSAEMREIIRGHMLKTQVQAVPPRNTPTMDTADTTKGKRFFWVRLAVRGPWIAAQAAYSDPNKGVFLPGTVGIQTAIIGPEIIPPGAFCASSELN